MASVKLKHVRTALVKQEETTLFKAITLYLDMIQNMYNHKDIGTFPPKKNCTQHRQ
jgi:hypothetical protein